MKIVADKKANNSKKKPAVDLEWFCFIIKGNIVSKTRMKTRKPKNCPREKILYF